MDAVRDVISNFYAFRQGTFVPEKVNFDAPWVKGKDQALMKQTDCAINWDKDTSLDIVRKVSSRDGQPGVLEPFGEAKAFFYGAHTEKKLSGRPKQILATRNGAVCFGTIDGAVWITHMRKSAAGQKKGEANCKPQGEKLYKLPSIIVLTQQLGVAPGVPEVPVGFEAMPAGTTYQDVVYQKRGEVGCVLFQFYNGAMAVEHCERLTACLKYAKTQKDTKAIVVAGGGVLNNSAGYFSNGVHLNLIDYAKDAAQEGWANINAIDDSCREIIDSNDHLIVTCICGNAGAGGIMMPLGADVVVSKTNLVFNPHYLAMGLYGSEYWTYTLPKRVGSDIAQRLTTECLPVSSEMALELGMVDRLVSGTCDFVVAEAVSEARRMCLQHDVLIAAKRKNRAADELKKPLQTYRDEELANMRQNFFNDSLKFEKARKDFVQKAKVTRAPERVAKHNSSTLASVRFPGFAGRPQLLGDKSLKQADPALSKLIEEEKTRQLGSVELIASENFTSQAVLECNGSILTNKYSEGQAGARYYGGNDVIDKIENLCKTRALAAFSLDEKSWGVNVQPYSGSPANFAVYTGLLQPHARIMGLDLPSGGHLTHGFYTQKKKISATSVYFESLPYKVHKDTGLIDFDDLRTKALCFCPALIIAGASAYPRHIDFERFRKICDEVGAMLLVDMAHIAGLVAAGAHPSPFEFADVVTTTTHKTIRGPRSGMIFFNTARQAGIKEKIDQAVFPGLQGGPHNHTIAGVAAQLQEVMSPDFKAYQRQVVANAKSLALELQAKGHKLATDGTDNHLVLWDLRPHGLTGSKVEKICNAAHISVNRNTVHGDVSALSPGGIRIGAPAMTTRGVDAEGFKKIAAFLDRTVQISLKIQAEKGKKLVEFEKGIPGNKDIAALRDEVAAFATPLGFPGLNFVNAMASITNAGQQAGGGGITLTAPQAAEPSGTPAAFCKVDGNAVAEACLAKCISRKIQGGLSAKLVVVQVGADPASSVYISKKKQACEKIGATFQSVQLTESVTNETLLRTIADLNGDMSVTGILVQLPLPQHLDTGRIMEAVAWEKDVDCFNPLNVGLLAQAKPNFMPATAHAVLNIMSFYEVPTKGKHCVVVGKSDLSGKPLSLLLGSEFGPACAVSSIDKFTDKSLSAKLIKSADILVVCAGVHHLINDASEIKQGCAIIDVGIHPKMLDGKRLLQGDVNYAAVKDTCSLITPVPGGVGPVTVAALMENLVHAAALQQKAQKNEPLRRISLPPVFQKEQMQEIQGLLQQLKSAPPTAEVPKALNRPRSPTADNKSGPGMQLPPLSPTKEIPSLPPAAADPNVMGQMEFLSQDNLHLRSRLAGIEDLLRRHESHLVSQSTGEYYPMHSTGGCGTPQVFAPSTSGGFGSPAREFYAPTTGGGFYYQPGQEQAPEMMRQPQMPPSYLAKTQAPPRHYRPYRPDMQGMP
jgi:glycine hydroxymethyltransferase